MVMLTMRQDFRAPAFGPASSAEIYAEGLAMWQWADAHGWDLAVVSEHHGLDDGWMPAPFTIAALGLGRTPRIAFFVSASLLPLHDPIRIAEQLAVLDNAAPGRLITIFGAGYRAEEFEMAGVPHADRTRLLEEYVGVVVRALTDGVVEWQGRTISVSPRPITQPHPAILVGGGVPAAGRRAARLRLPMMPMNTDPRVREAYEEEAARIGYTDGYVMHPVGPTFVHVTEDPDKTWADIGEFLFYETSTYASFQTPGQTSANIVHADTIDEIKRADNVWVVTPDELVARVRANPHISAVNFHPLAGGLPPRLAWESLELFDRACAPQLQSS